MQLKFPYFLRLLLVAIIGVNASPLLATHTYTAHLSYEHTNMGNTYTITLRLYQDCGGLPFAATKGINIASPTLCGAPFNATLNLVSSQEVTSPHLCSAQLAQTTCNGGSMPGVEEGVYTGNITLPSSCADWVVSYTECCRNASIVNISNPSSASIFGALVLDNLSFAGGQINETFSWNAPSVVFADINELFVYTPNCIDPEGDALDFELTEIRSANGAIVAWNMGYSTTQPFNSVLGITVDNQTGRLEAIPNNMGIYTFSYQVTETRNGTAIGLYSREITLYVVNEANNLPYFSQDTVLMGATLSNDTIRVCAGSNALLRVTANDADAADTVDLDVLNNNFAAVLGVSNYSFFAAPQANNVLDIIFSISPDISHIGTHDLYLGVADGHCGYSNGIATKHYVLVVEDCSFLSTNTNVCPLMGANDTITGCLAGISVMNYPLEYWLVCAPSYGSIMLSDSCYQYISNGVENVTDTVCIEICDTVQSICDTMYLIIPIGSCVFPGDADTNNVVDNMDLLPLGLGMGYVGYERPNASLNYICQPAQEWATATPVTGINYKHSDTNGDSIITAADTMAIVQNWGLVHLRVGGGATGDIPLYVDMPTCICPLIPGQAVAYPLMLGDASFSVTAGYGLAFTLNYDNEQIDTNSIWIDFSPCWLGDINTGEAIALQRDFYDAGLLQTAITRTNGQGVNGQGQIGVLHFTIKDDILRQNFVNVEMAFTDIRLIDHQEMELGTNPMPISMQVVDTLSGVHSMVWSGNDVAVFPNPNNGYFVVQTSANIESLTLFNALGQMVHQSNNSSRELNLQGVLAEGVYMLYVQTDKGLVVKRLTIK